MYIVGVLPFRSICSLHFLSTPPTTTLSWHQALSRQPAQPIFGSAELTVVPRSESPSILHLWWQRRLASERGLETSETSRPPRNLSWHQALSRQPAQPLFGSAELTVIRRSKSPSEVPDWSYLLWQRRLASRPPGSSVACFNPRVGLLNVEWVHV